MSKYILSILAVLLLLIQCSKSDLTNTVWEVKYREDEMKYEFLTKTTVTYTSSYFSPIHGKEMSNTENYEYTIEDGYIKLKAMGMVKILKLEGDKIIDDNWRDDGNPLIFNRVK